MTDKIDVLDHGYVRVVDTLGSDLSVVNAARVSYSKESTTLDYKDEKLIDFLIREKHDSPLRHAAITFEVYAPLEVARQWWKHAVGSTHTESQQGWNESCLPVWQELWSYGNLRFTVQDALDGKQIPLRSVNDDNVVVPNRIAAVWPSGKQAVFTAIDEFGNKVSATGNHRVLTPNGYRPLKDLGVGDLIAHNGMPAYTDKSWLANMAETHTAVEIAKIADVTTRTIHEYKKKFGIATTPHVSKPWANREWLKEHYVDKNMTLVETASLAGCSTHTIRKWAKKFGLQKDNIQVLKDWQKENGTFIPSQEVALERAQKSKQTRLNKYGKSGEYYGDGGTYRRIALQQEGWTTCFYCESPIDEIHHKDRNRDNNAVENLVGLCSEHHYLIHGKRPAVVGFSKIVSIEDAGVWDTYDIEMELEDNFIAGGIVVHNSRRYVTESPEFYIPNHFRSKPENSKQGAGDYIEDGSNFKWRNALDSFYGKAEELYEMAMKDGIAPEQARLFLPAYGLYVRWRWTASLDALLNFISLRLGEGAQNEITEYANAVGKVVIEKFPATFNAWVKYRVEM